MSYQLEISNEQGYLHATVTGQNSEDNVRRYMAELLLECERSGCRLLLIEERLEGPRLDGRTVFEIVSEGSETSRAILRAIAFVDVVAKSGPMKNIEALAANRGQSIKVAETVAEAEQWLSDRV